MHVVLLNHSANPSLLVASSAKLCYSSSNIQDLQSGLTEESANAFVEMLAKLGHESPMEHVCFTFGIEGVSRSLLAQITRHRMASFSVQSQRYVRENQFQFVVPPAIQKNEGALSLYLKAMEEDQQHYTELTKLLLDGYLSVLDEEEKKDPKVISKWEKVAIEDARFVLPNSAETKMMVTMNVRSLHNFFQHRCCERAQWEIRELADRMLALVYDVAPSLFAKGGPSCVKAGCSEGSMTCGRISDIREKYKNIKM